MKYSAALFIVLLAISPILSISCIPHAVPRKHDPTTTDTLHFCLERLDGPSRTHRRLHWLNYLQHDLERADTIAAHARRHASDTRLLHGLLRGTRGRVDLQAAIWAAERAGPEERDEIGRMAVVGMEGKDGLKAAIASLTHFHATNQLYIAYVSSKPMDTTSDFGSHIEMVMTVLATDRSPFQSHVGITRTFHHLSKSYHRRQHTSSEPAEHVHEGLAMLLQGFAAREMQKAEPGRVYVISSPTKHMLEITKESVQVWVGTSMTALRERVRRNDQLSGRLEQLQTAMIMARSRQEGLAALDDLYHAFPTNVSSHPIEEHHFRSICPAPSSVFILRHWQMGEVLLWKDGLTRFFQVNGEESAEDYSWFFHHPHLRHNLYATARISAMADLFNEQT